MRKDTQVMNVLFSQIKNHSKTEGRFALPITTSQLQPRIKCTFKRIKLVFILLNILLTHSWSQDTLMYLNGKVKHGRVIGIDANMGLMEFKNVQEHELISLDVLKTYTTNQLEANWTMKNNFTLFQSSIYTVKEMGYNRRLLDFTPGKYSIGLNFTTLFNPGLVNDFDYFGRTYSTNSHIETFCQIELNPRMALRFPLRIGLKPIQSITTANSYDFYGSFSRELIGDIGIEPIFYFNQRLVKLKWFAAPSMSLVLGRSVKRTITSEPYTTIYTPLSTALCYRIGALTGFQYWLNPHFQLESSFGYLITNNYWEPTFSESDVLMNRPYFARNLRLALIYRM
jgi:hypothetical protein